VGVELPVVVADKVLHELVVVALGCLPSEAEYVKTAATGFRFCWRRAACCQPMDPR
jgi:hypothetical protein